MMDSHFYIEYEIIDFIKDKSFVTRTRAEAVEYFRSGWRVVEKHITVSRPKINTSVSTETAVVWDSEFDINNEEN